MGKAIGWFALAGLGFLIGVPNAVLAFYIAFITETCVDLGPYGPCAMVETAIAFAGIGGGVMAGRNGVEAWGNRGSDG